MTENNVNFCYSDCYTGKYLFLFMRKACLWLKYEFLSVFKLPYPFTPPPKKTKKVASLIITFIKSRNCRHNQCHFHHIAFCQNATFPELSLQQLGKGLVGKGY